jgi:hypothetical protein
MNTRLRSTLCAALLFACAPSQMQQASDAGAAAKTTVFVYSPMLNHPHRETMKRMEEVAIPGSPMRNKEEWVMDWDVMTTQESNLFRRTLKLVGLKIAVNDAQLLRGDEVQPKTATLDVLTDKDSNVVDVRGADQFSDAIVSLGAPDARPALARAFSPERLKALAVERSTELHSDFVGRPAQVGATWMANDPNGGGTRQIRVLAAAPCGGTQCLQVRRYYDVDRQSVYAGISDKVDAYVKSQGGDPSKVAVTGMELKLEDSLLMNPASMDYYAAQFVEDATIHVSGPNGDLPIAFKQRRQTEYRY